MRISDPEEKIISVEVQDSKGEPLDNNGVTTMGDIKIFDYASPLPDGARLTDSLKTDKALTRHPFQVKDIALP